MESRLEDRADREVQPELARFDGRIEFLTILSCPGRSAVRRESGVVRCRAGIQRPAKEMWVPALRCTTSCCTASGTRELLCRLCVVLHRRTRAHQVAVAIDVVDAADRAPVFVGA